MNGELPEGWAQPSLAVVLRELRTGPFGSTLHKSDYVTGGVPVINPLNIVGGRIQPTPSVSVNHRTSQRLQQYVLRQGDIVIARRGEMGRCALVTESEAGWLCGTGSAILRFKDGVLPEFARSVISSSAVRRYLSEASVGSTMDNLNQKVFKEMPFPLPPTAEQHRIVAKLDSLLRSVDECQRRFEKIPAILKRFRQAVMVAACSGRLTEDCRARDLSRTVSEGDAPADAPDCPPSWRWFKLSDLAEIRGGVTKGRKLAGKLTISLPYLRVANVQDGFLDLSEIKRIEVLPEERMKYRLNAGDVLFTEGGDRDKLGRGTVWRDEIPYCIHQNHIFRARLTSGNALPTWVSLASKSDFARRYFLENASQTVNLASINLSVLSALPIPLPRLAEQEEIVRRVGNLFRLAKSVESRLELAKVAVTNLVQSFLAKTLRGELVPAEAELAEAERRTYETAEELLARINGTAMLAKKSAALAGK